MALFMSINDKKILMGNEAMARGLVESGCTLAVP
jgi:TPP-dependent indolepyruvate ferredoxin oxidoreductase alpha subunit